jgi:6-phosphogluconolactonase
VSSDRRVIVHTDPPALARAVAARFITTAVEVLAHREAMHIVLTGGSVGIAVLREIAEHADSDTIDWSRVHAWWGDERWVDRDHADRNAVQAREALLDRIALPAENIHEFPAADDGLSLQDAAASYREELLTAGAGHMPTFAITFLGVGPDGHIASLFPEREGPLVTDQTVLAVDDSPKPPPQRLTLSLPLLNGSERIWLVLAGADKASALGLALAGASTADVPVAGVRAAERTIFFVDEAAASEVPESLITPPEYWTGAMEQPDWSPSAD